MNSLHIKKIGITTTLFIFVANPLFVFAQSYNTTNAPRAIIVDENKTYQNVNLQSSQANEVNSYSTKSKDSSGGFGACAGSGAVANFIKGKISSYVGSIASTDVLVNESVMRGKDTGILGAVSWDQLGWCLVNATIESVGAATVQWINGGFQGNPVFVQDPGQFFADVADIQAGAFINELSNGFLCEPIRNVVRVNLANNYNGQIGGYSPQCTFTGAAGNLEQFMAGDSFSWADWDSYTQNPQNNPFGATLAGQVELDRRIASALGVQSKVLDWGVGFLSSKDPETGKITSPGSLIQDGLNDRLGSGQRRLEIADEFDEIVNALVNQLVKVAISEMTQGN